MRHDVGEFGQEFVDAVGRLVERQCGIERFELLEAATALGGFLREEPDEMDFVGRQTAGGESRHERTGARNGFNSMAGGECGADDSLAGIADAGSAGVGDERDFLALGEALDDVFAPFRFVEFKVTQERLFDFISLEQMRGVARILGGEYVAFTQNAEGPEGDVFQVSDGGGDQIKRSSDQRWQLLAHPGKKAHWE